MCGSDSGWIWGGLIVAGAMLVWAFASNGEATHREAPAAQTEAPAAQTEAPASHADATLLTVSADGVALRFEDARLTIRVSL